MLRPIESPLDYYLQTGKAAHEKNVDECLKIFTDHAAINREENAQTVAEYHAKALVADETQEGVSGKKTGRTWAIIGLIAVFIALSVLFFNLDVMEAVQTMLFVVNIAAFIVGLCFTCKAFNKRIRALEQKLFNQRQAAAEVLAQAEKQMQPLNDNFPEDICLRLMEKTLPCFAFDAFFTKQRLDGLVANYGMSAGIGGNESVMETLSGELQGRPFVYDRRRIHEMGSKTYQGSLTIHWTTRERDSQGNTVTRNHSQTLTASVSKPYPQYTLRTLLYYGNEGAESLSFSRTYAHAEDKNERQLERTMRKGERKLRRLESKDLREGGDFTQVENTQFEVLFNATNRSDELEFREMFTVHAQQNMVELLLYGEGYGDDFGFFKQGKLNVIYSEHSQSRPLSVPACFYRSYDITKAEAAFREHNNEFFKAVYFDFAPLLVSPVYQQDLRVSQAIVDGERTPYNYEQYANEAASLLTPTPCDTCCIFKARLLERKGNAEIVEIVALGYYGEARVEYVRKHGNDGRWHNVPVEWTEYLPVERRTKLHVVPVKSGERAPADAVALSNAYAYVVEG